MTREDPPLRIRLPAELKKQIQDLAAKSHRSMNAEIISRLEFSITAGAVVQETGWDVEHGHDTPEFRLAYQRTQPLDKRVADLEDQVAALLKIIAKK
jgi:hypothetical protein